MVIIVRQIDRVTEIKVRKLLRHLYWHDRVRYSGPLWMIGITGRPPRYVGEDYDFYDPFNKEWDSDSAFRSKTSTREYMRKIIEILKSKNPNKGFTIGRYSYTQRLNRF
jgi:hypothetical protein